MRGSTREVREDLEFSAQLVLFGLPVLTYALFLRGRGRSWRRTIYGLGWRRSDRRYYGYALLTAGSLAAVLYFSSNLLVPPDYPERPGLSTSYYAGLDFGFSAVLFALLRESVYVALGEEAFFCGLLGGRLTSRFGFYVGNVFQTLAFLLPHLLLVVGIDLWPLLLLPLSAGWLLG